MKVVFRYRSLFSFLSSLIVQAEEHGNEVEEELYLELSKHLTAAPQKSGSELGYRSYNIVRICT